MHFMRFRSFADLAILLGICITLAGVGGCGSADNAAQLPEKSQPATPATTPDGSELPPSPPAETPAAIDPPPSDPAPGAPQPLADLPALPDATELPAGDGNTPEEGGVVWALPPPDTEAAPGPMPADPNHLDSTPAQPVAARELRPNPTRPAPGRSAEPNPRGPFSENPLREGTDDFPAEPIKAVSAPTVGAAAPTPSPNEVASRTEPAGRNKPPKKRFGKGKHNPDFDPIAVNGPIFVDWEKPKLALLISGRQDGYLEPCGCAGLDRMKGGLTRRHSLFRKLKADGWPVVGIDCGGLVKGFGRQAELKFHLSVDAMQKMGYDAIALGKSDLRLPAGELLSRVASSDGAPSPFLSANVAVFGFAAGMTANHRIVEAGGLRVGISSVLGTSWQKEINNSDIEMADPRAKLREVVPELEKRSDLIVLLAHASMEESLELAREFPQFDIVVTGGGNPVPPKDMQVLDNGTRLIEVGEKGMDAIVLGIYEGGRIEYQRVPLDSRFEDSQDMKEFMRQYQEQLKADGLAGLGIRPVPHPRAEELGRFVGSRECESCHEPSYEVWKDTGHSDAWKTLVELEIPRIHDPECISCHVVGWHPTEYFPYESGFLSEEETPDLVDVGCESCHGPGENHVKAEMGSDEQLQEKLRKAMTVTKEQAQHDKAHWCLNCHDLDNSPDFDFDEYWPHVEHTEDIWADE